MKLRFLFLTLLVLAPSVSYAADGILFLAPARGTYTTGEEFEIDVVADTGGTASNAAEADISFNPAALSVVSISTDGSVLSLWPSPPSYSNTDGTIRFSGTAGSGFSSDTARLIRIMFRAKGNLPGDVHFDSGAILANDARATNIIASMQSGLYTIEAARTQPAQEPAPVAAPEAQTPVTPEVKGASIQIPAITGYDDRVAVGGRIVLQGSAAPSSQLVVSLQFEDDAPRESTVLSTSDGKFTYIAADPAESGVYRAWASVSRGVETFSSEKVVFSARTSGVAAAAASLIPMLTLALPYLLLLIVTGLSLGFFYNRRAKAQR